ncbi:hypothetical protein BTJ40_11490 [Microbulbifer sp. A4B17]|uniref:MFS transporter n=1 Tax=Microbulbifer sp. A4B17 TaxID=359370 RepID=UPI000D52C9DB|nr:MFS transporter [Microbulbifer sp. A4B17]AWF81390.1 hypothetical protein BTJ40_11490 [Microbulbifer sp. A4B17]
MNLSDQHRQFLIICSMGALSGIVFLDETVVGVALPAIRDELGLAHDTAHWIINAYFLTLTCFAALGGKCIDMFGLRVILAISTPIFVASSIWAGFTNSGSALITARVFQGVSAAFIFSLSQAGTYLAFPKDKRGYAIGIYAAISTAFLAVGPIAGGLITHFLSWRWIFWITIPVVLLSAIFALLVWRQPEESSLSRSRLDTMGVALMLVGLTGLVYALMQGARLGWSSFIILGSGVVGLLSLFFFGRYELRQSKPLIDVSLLRHRPFMSAIYPYIIAEYSVIATAVFFPIYLQDILDFTTAQAGLALIPAVLPFPLVSIYIGRLADKIGSRRIVLVGTLLGGVVTILLAVLLPFKIYPPLAVLLLLWGVAMSCTIGPARRLASHVATLDNQGQLSGTIVTLRLLGATAGVAASSALLTNGFPIPSVFLLTGMLLLTSFVSTYFLMKG